jgi:hypothetical protein
MCRYQLRDTVRLVRRFRFAYDWLYRMHTRWFKLSVETFDAIHYAGMATYKLGIILLNLVPLLALYQVA